jgi:Protein of unknown function (DUF2842)
MSTSIKKLIGTIVTVVWLAFYVFLAAGFGRMILPHAAWYAAFLYYALAGTLWIIPIGLMLPWMYREPKRPSP